jgi:CheY-like chemotaxis protein
MTHKLLVADDSVTVQRVVELTFANEGVQVVAVGDGAQAIAAIERERPDVVLADVGMPERDGYEVAAFVKGAAHLAAIPVVLMTGAFEQIDESRARAVGCDGVLAKPFEPHMAIALVRQLLAGAAPAESAADVAAASVAPHAGFPFDPGADVPATTSSLDDYFDRLDEALASAPAPTPRPPEPPPSGPPVAGPASAARAAGDVVTPRGRPPVTSLADAFSVLLADELGEPAGPPASPRAAPGSSLAPATPALHVASVPAPSQPVVSDDLVEAVTRRVMERLGDQAVRDLVASTVLDVAERLVREEIERIKAEA